MVDIRIRDSNNRIGKKRVNELLPFFEDLQPKHSDAEASFYEDSWKEEDFPFDEEYYQVVLAKEEE